MESGGNLSKRIKDFNARFLQDKVKIKYSTMAGDPFRFFRGTCHLFYEDLAKAPPLPFTPDVWLSGDLHLENFGTYKGDNRLVYFDLNDFDESILGPASWELVRIISSIFVGFESLKISEQKALRWAESFLKTYKKILSREKARFIETETSKGIVRSFMNKVCKRTVADMLREQTYRKKDKICLLTDELRHLKIAKDFRLKLRDHINEWMKMQQKKKKSFNYEVLDVCFRIAGTGSLGVKRYLFLLQNEKKGNDLLFLDMKQALPSSLSPYIKINQPVWENEATRVMNLKRRLQNVPPALLGTTEFERDFFVLQEMQPTEDKINFKVIKDRYADVAEVINDMALLTASAQLRSSGRQGSAIADDLIAFGYNNNWHNEILEYSINYSRQVKQDYKQYKKDFDEGYFEQV